MTFSKRKKAPPGAVKESGKTVVVSVRLKNEQYQIALENCRKSGRKLSDYWRCALTKSEVIQVAQPEDMALLRQIGSMANNLNQLAKKANEGGFKLVQWSLDKLSKEIKSLYTKCGHISLSYSPEDSARLSDEAMVKLALEYMEKMGIKNTQFIIARHLDKEHPHCHIVYNRVDNNGRCVSDSYEYHRSNAICKELKKKYGLTFGENKDKVKVDRLKGRSKTRQEIYLAVQAAKRTAKDWTSFQRELAQKGISVRKKFRRGTTDVEGLSYIKDGQKFKASQVDSDGRCSYNTICNALNRNKNHQTQLSASAPRPMQQQPKQAPSAAANIIDAGADITESLGNAIGGLFQVGPAYDQDEEAFIREMNRRKKRKRGRSL